MHYLASSDYSYMLSFESTARFICCSTLPCKPPHRPTLHTAHMHDGHWPRLLLQLKLAYGPSCPVAAVQIPWPARSCCRAPGPCCLQGNRSLSGHTVHHRSLTRHSNPIGTRMSLSAFGAAPGDRTLSSRRGSEPATYPQAIPPLQETLTRKDTSRHRGNSTQIAAYS